MGFSCGAVEKEKGREQWVCVVWSGLYVACILCVVHGMAHGYGLHVVCDVCWVCIWCECLVFMIV